MPISHSALKQLRKDKVRQVRNAAMRSELKTVTKKFLVAVKENRVDEARSLLQALSKKYDVAASKHIIHRNAASRSKSRLTRKLVPARAAA
jgi:small subunit ribosomal protein S20